MQLLRIYKKKFHNHALHEPTNGAEKDRKKARKREREKERITERKRKRHKESVCVRARILVVLCINVDN